MIPLDMKITAIGNWFGADREACERIAPELPRRPLAVVPFAGGMSITPFLQAEKVLLNDAHRHVINLARVIRDPASKARLAARLNAKLFHPDELDEAQQFCRDVEDGFDARGLFAMTQSMTAPDPVDWAESYAVCQWMSRGGAGGCPGEFTGGLPIRYSPNGGGSNQRFRSWCDSLDAWHDVFRFRNAEFSTDDALVMLWKTHDSPRVLIYVDAPWPDAGDVYSHKFNPVKQRQLAKMLTAFGRSGPDVKTSIGPRVVVRYADHPLIREIYPEPHWTWITYPSRDQHGKEFTEVLLVNGVAAGKAST